MNARKIIAYVGMALAVLVASLVAVALWALKKMETEKNATRTARAREARWKRQEETPPSQSQEKVESSGVTELKEEIVNTGDNEETTQQSEPEKV